MIVVNSSVWIDFFNGRATSANGALKQLLADGDAEIIVPDLVLYEVLRGFRIEREWRQARQLMTALTVESACDEALAQQAAQCYRRLRAEGFTIRSPIDTLLGAFCIERGHAMLHADADFDVMADVLGLRVIRH